MTTIELVANDQLLQVTVSPKISSGEVNTVSIHVDFSDEWNNFGKNAVFYTSYNSRDIYEIVMTNDECIVPSEVMSKAGTLYIGIRGVNDNKVKTTSLVKLKISEGTPTDNSRVEPTPDVYQQLLTAYGKTEESIAVERARIDNLSTLKEGSTTGDAELLDIRVKADGTTATSAGNAVREQVSELKSDLVDITEVEQIKYISGKYIASHINPISMIDGKPSTDISGTYNCAYIKCAYGDRFLINGKSTNSNIKVWFFIDINGNQLLGANYNLDITNGLIITAPQNAEWLILNTENFDIKSWKGLPLPIQLDEIRNHISDNKSQIVKNDYLALNTLVSKLSPIERNDYEILSGIDFNESNVVSSINAISIVMRITPNMAVNIKKKQTVYTKIAFCSEYPKNGTPINSRYMWNGVVNTDVSAQSSNSDNYMICLFYMTGTDSVSRDEVIESLQVYYDALEYLPFDTVSHLDNNMINLLKYRPLGKLTKPYIALSCDDGRYALATYTLQRAKDWKTIYGINIPITMGLFDDCDVLVDSEQKSLVVEMCNDYGCSIAIHGRNPYPYGYNRKYFVNFLKTQENKIKSITGVKPSSILYPHHEYNDEIKTICGSFYGICGCGGNIHNMTYHDDAMRYFYNGEKSNLYTIYRFDIHAGLTKDDIRGVLDFALKNNYLICPYFHDIDLVEGDNIVYNREILELIVSYGFDNGFNFISFDEIPEIL